MGKVQDGGALKCEGVGGRRSRRAMGLGDRSGSRMAKDIMKHRGWYRRTMAHVAWGDTRMQVTELNRIGGGSTSREIRRRGDAVLRRCGFHSESEATVTTRHTNGKCWQVTKGQQSGNAH